MLERFCWPNQSMFLSFLSLMGCFVSDQSVPLPLLHGDGPGGDHHRVVRHQHAASGRHKYFAKNEHS